MAIGAESAGLEPVTAIALVGGLGVAAQWLAWRFHLPGIVLMLAAGLLIGPGLGILDPARDFGDLLTPFVSVAVAIILFEGGLTLDFRTLRGAEQGVRRLVMFGVPIGWLLSALALHVVGGLSWPSATVFGGIMIVTGPTVIAPLLRQARLNRRPAQLLQWEAIINDPIGALAAVLAFQVVVISAAAVSVEHAVWSILQGVAAAGAAGACAGWVLAGSFRRGYVPEYMKVPVLFAGVLAIFAITESVLRESGLLAVTVMGMVMANAHLPSYAELRRFKEHATILLVSGVFILLAANLDSDTLALINWHAVALVAVVILIVRPVTVLLSLIGTSIPFPERVLVGLTGPRGVILVAVAGFFGDRLVALGIEDAAFLTPFAFALVGASVVLHGFTLAPLARVLGLAGRGVPGLILAGSTPFAVALARAIRDLDINVIVTDSNHARLRLARDAALPVFWGDILSEAAEHSVEIMQFSRVLALTDNDAYNTLVATDLAPEFGRNNVFQLARSAPEGKRHSLPATLGGRIIAGGLTCQDIALRMEQGWDVRSTHLTKAFGLKEWHDVAQDAVLLAIHGPDGTLSFVTGALPDTVAPDSQILWLGHSRHVKNPVAPSGQD